MWVYRGQLAPRSFKGRLFGGGMGEWPFMYIYIYTYAGMLVKVIKSVCRVRLLHYDQYMF